VLIIIIIIIIRAVRMSLPHYAPHAHGPDFITHKLPIIADMQEIKVMKIRGARLSTVPLFGMLVRQAVS
jgi:hypothetical protein